MIRLKLRARPPVRLSLRGFIPERLAALSADAMARETLRQGNRAGVLGDLFDIDVSGGAVDRLVVSGPGDRLDDVGAEMTRGEVVVEGNVGARVGLEMRGGRILIEGSAGYGAGMAMRGGELRIAGNAGDHVGTALPGEREGMRNGILIVEGDAGAGVGDRMRLGLLAVMGSVGPHCGARMGAGTIVVGGEVGDGAGAAMRRGSLVAAGGNLRTLPGFSDSGVQDVVVLRLLARMLAKHQLGELVERLSGLRRWQGDLAVGGKGEIWTAP
jgi:formylmethanofuran dehydrogenase subunit C